MLYEGAAILQNENEAEFYRSSVRSNYIAPSVHYCSRKSLASHAGATATNLLGATSKQIVCSSHGRSTKIQACRGLRNPSRLCGSWEQWTSPLVMHRHSFHYREKLFQASLRSCWNNRAITTSLFHWMNFKKIDKEVKDINQCQYPSIIIVVAEVPSSDMEAISGRRWIGMSSSRAKMVSFHERTQSMDSSIFLDKRKWHLSSATQKPDQQDKPEDSDSSFASIWRQA